MRQVTLSFDNGPEPGVTPAVLDILARRGIRASFFVMGYKVATPGGRALSARAGAEGHWIGNHTFSHTRPLGELDAVAALKEFEQAEQALAWLDQTPRLFRPYGRAGALGPHLLHPAVVEKLIAGRYSCVLWNCVPRDWKDPKGWVEHGIAQCQSRDWSLVVLHDTPTGAMLGLDRFLQSLADLGITFVQEYPPDCVPIEAGRVTAPLEPWTSAPHDHPAGKQ